MTVTASDVSTKNRFMGKMLVDSRWVIGIYEVDRNTQSRDWDKNTSL